MNVLHEERPRAESRRRHRPDGYEYILVQVTQNDINAGENKINQMQRDGWALAADRETGIEGYHYMKKPKSEMERLAQERLNKYLKWTQAPLADTVNSAIPVSREESGPDDAIDPQSIAALEKLAAAANS